jgi:hypothetical protein
MVPVGLFPENGGSMTEKYIYILKNRDGSLATDLSKWTFL